MENLSKVEVFKDKLSNAASGVYDRMNETVGNVGARFGKGRASEDNPMNYKVTHKGGALVREGVEISSRQVHQLAAGEVVAVVEIAGRRARIVTPMEGWMSIETKDGVEIMRPCNIQYKSQQNEAFESMFEKKFSRLKEKQRDRGDDRGGDPRVDRSPSRSYSPRDRSYSPRRRDDSPRRRDDYSPRRRDDYSPRRRDDYSPRRRDDSPPRGKSDRGSRRDDDRVSSKGDAPKAKLAAPGDSSSGAVPRLSGPGSLPAPRTTSGGGTMDLLDMDDSKPEAAPAAAGAMSGSDMFADFSSAPAPAQSQSMGGMPYAPAGQMPTPCPGAGMAGGPGFMPSAGMQGQQGCCQGSMGGPCGANWGAFGGNAQQPAMQGMQGMCGMQPGGMPPMQGMGGMQMQNMQGMMPGGMQMGGGMQQGFNPMMGQAQFPQQQGAWGCGGGQQQQPGFQGAGMGFAPCGMPQGFANGSMPQQQQPQQSMQMQQSQMSPQGAGSCAAATSGSGSTTGSGVDDLLSKAAAGVANMSFEQRNAAAPQQAPRGTPMNNMSSMGFR